MTPQERDLLEGLFARIRTAPAGARDAEADAFISEQVRQTPQAAYLLTQTVIVQEETLKAAAAKIDELNARITQLEEAKREQPSSFLGGVGRSIFAASRRARPSRQRALGRRMAGAGAADGGPAPFRRHRHAERRARGSRWTQQGRPLAAAEQQQQGGGGSFLKGALGAAAGVRAACCSPIR